MEDLPHCIFGIMPLRGLNEGFFFNKKKGKKNKGDIRNIGLIKLISHTIKLWGKVIKRGLGFETQIVENQFGRLWIKKEFV